MNDAASEARRGRRPNLEGTVYRESRHGREVWRAAFPTLGADGRVVTRRRQFDNEEAAEAHRAAMVEAFRKARTAAGTGKVELHQNSTVLELAVQWLSANAGFAESYKRSLKSIIRHWIAPFPLSEIRLGDLTREHVAAWLEAVRSTPSGRTGKPLSEAALHSVFRPVRTMLRSAGKLGLLAGDPLGGVTPPPTGLASHGEYAMPSEAQVQALLRAQGSHCIHVAGAGHRCPLRWHFALGLAARPSEALALRLEDLSEEPDGSIRVRFHRHSVSATLTHGCGAPMASEDGRPAYPCGESRARDCPQRRGGVVDAPGMKSRPLAEKVAYLPAALAPLYRDHLAALPDGAVFLFPGPDGLARRRSEWDQRLWDRACVLAGWSEHHRRYAARHYSVTQAVKVAGPMAAQYLAGHASLNTTLQFYTHASAELGRQATDAIVGSLIGSDSVKAG